MRSDTARARRAFLASSLGVGSLLAGCTGRLTDDSDADADVSDGYGIVHPIADWAENDPVLGPPPDEAEFGLILVSDPSCQYCREFDAEIFEPMKADLIDEGRLSYVYRPYPKVRDWATLAGYAMLAAWERDGSAFLPLKRHYYETAVELSERDLPERTADLLDAETGVDGEEVVAAVEDRELVDELAETGDAVREADMTTVPSYAILSEGEVTTTSGVQSYGNVKRMLGVE